MNAKAEFLKHVGTRQIKCAFINHEVGYDKFNEYQLRPGYSEEDFAKFLESISFKYDDGFGGQMLYGIIWYRDGTWSERGEYDGSEWWNHKKIPEISEYLNQTS